MLAMNLQFFSHHKGGGSTANGRNSAGRRLGTKAADGSSVHSDQSSIVNVELIFTQATMLSVVTMTHCLQ